MVPAMPNGVPFEPAVLERARRSRDARFDGRFYFGVVSTGIYCRPICPAAPAARSLNVRYFATAAAAREAGFRPCLRCRPESAPGTPAWLGTTAVVRRALRLIQQGALDEASVAQFAARLGLGPRQLDRRFGDVASVCARVDQAEEDHRHRPRDGAVRSRLNRGDVFRPRYRCAW